MSTNSYAEQFTALKGEGHKRPPAAFGAPTLVWHIGVWPQKAHAAADTKPEIEFHIEPVDSKKDADGRHGYVKDHGSRIYEKAHVDHRRKREEFVESINRFLRKIQDGRRIASGVDQFHWVKFDPHDKKASFKILDHDSVGFTLWWSGHRAVSAGEFPGEDAIRVRVQVEAHQGHFTFSFYMDASKIWLSSSSAQDKIYNLNDPACRGETRRKIFQHVEDVRGICDKRISNSVVDDDLIPEILLDDEKYTNQAETLREAAKFLYKDVWEQFCHDLGFGRHDIAGEMGEIFAEFRGLVHAVRDGCEHGPALSANLAHAPYPKFVHDEKDTSPANRVLKAYWPFVRRISPYADYREFIACGMMDWRALCVSALGSRDEFDPRDESESRLVEVPGDHLIEPGSYEDFVERQREKAVRHEHGEPAAPTPIRYLFLTKCDPDRRQIGRIVSRVFSLGTMRHFAMKDLDVLREASLHIRMRGQHLDEVMKAWSKTRKKISEFVEEEERLRRFGQDDTKETIDTKDTELYNLLTDLTKYVEQDLIEINAYIEELGDESVGGLPYAINRSRYFIRSFLEAMKTLRIGNIDGWVAYDFFVHRRLMPTFDFINSTGERLKSLRDRLRAVTESIQTSAVQIQTAATRRNTDTLRVIGSRWQKTNKILTKLKAIGYIVAVLQALWLFGFKDAAQFGVCNYIISKYFPDDGPKVCPDVYFQKQQIAPKTTP